MDESAIELDAPSNYSYERRGAKRVAAVTSGAERTKMSCAFTASASGEKLPILILVPRKFPLKNFTPPNNVIVHYQRGKTTFDSEVIKILDFYFSTCYKNIVASRHNRCLYSLLSLCSFSIHIITNANHLYIIHTLSYIFFSTSLNITFSGVLV